MNISYGASSDKFGHQDYFQMLKSIWDTSDFDSRQQKLAQKRQDVLAWMKDPGNVDKIGEENRQGQQGGLFEQISSGDLTHKFSGKAAGSGDWIGHADLYAGRAAGHSWGDIRRYLDQNTSKLRGGNVKGGGGLYDQVASEARFEHTTNEQNKNWSDLIANMQTSFDDSLAQQQDFQRAQLDWQSTESQAQRDHEAATRAHEAAMLAEQRKVKTATPTHVKNPISQLAIGPGKVAAPQSASSLARKRLGSAPLVTGLNIGSKKTSMNIK